MQSYLYIVYIIYYYINDIFLKYNLYQDKSDFKAEEEEKAPLEISDVTEEAESENLQSLNSELAEQKSTTEETEDTEKETGTEEVIESEVSNEILKCIYIYIFFNLYEELQF